MEEQYEATSKALRDFFGRPDPVGFRQGGVQPPSALYITRDDRLLVRARNVVSAVSVGIRGRILQPDPIERIKYWQRNFVPAATGSTVSEVHELGEGFLLSLSLFVDAAVPRRGQCFVQAGLVKGAAGLGVFTALLISDYLVAGDLLGWPGGVLRSSTEGKGFSRSFSGTNPAAGVEISETVPTERRWRPYALRAQLVTSAVAGARAPHLVLDDGATIYQEMVPSLTQAASLTRQWGFYNLGAADKSENTAIVVAGGPFPQMIQGHRIRTVTTALDAGDDWAAPQLLVEEWLED